MTWLPDSTLAHLRLIADWPDFSKTKYDVFEKLGQGGMASVYAAHDRDLDRRVAIKVIHVPVVDSSIQERMLFEARIVARLEHPGILPVHDIGFLPDGRIYYVMKLVRGQRLDAFLNEAMSLPDRLRLFLRICDAVAFAHSHDVIHRDLKPSNIMIGDFGEVLVIDWGLAKVLSGTETARAAVPPKDASMRGITRSDRTLHGDVLGTPGFMAPEQEYGHVESIDQRTDVYALGILLEFLLPADSPKAVRAIVDKARCANLADRYSTVAVLSRDVSSFLDGERVAAFPEGLWETGRRLIKRHRTVVILIATYLIVRVILLLMPR
jgi:serine/threonine protein kinase